jgi:hypothetical protein
MTDIANTSQGDAWNGDSGRRSVVSYIFEGVAAKA